MELWRCPDCRREFARQEQRHSCVSVSVDDHFLGRPVALRRVSDRLVAALKESGLVRVDPVTSAINLAGRFHFAMVYVQQDGLTVEFGLGRVLKGA